jgi:hypothetical protein
MRQQRSSTGQQKPAASRKAEDQLRDLDLKCSKQAARLIKH